LFQLTIVSVINTYVLMKLVQIKQLKCNYE